MQAYNHVVSIPEFGSQQVIQIHKWCYLGTDESFGMLGLLSHPVSACVLKNALACASIQALVGGTACKKHLV